MSEATILWLLGTVIGVQTLVIGWLTNVIWSHVRECRAFRESVAKISAQLERAIKDIGDHETGIIGQLHRYSKEIVLLNARLGNEHD